MRYLWCGLVLATLALGQNARAGDGAAAVSSLSGEFRNGQVFLTWSEGETPAGTSFNVYSSATALDSAASLKTARVLARHVHRHSARDWWQDPASFKKGEPPADPVGFAIREGAGPLNPAAGLFVHTVTRDTAGPRFYAVTVSDPSGQEDLTLRAGHNRLATAVEGRVEQPLPVWQGKGSLPAKGSAKGRKLCLRLHGRGGGATAGPRKGRVNCLWFGDARQGWREGLAFKFRLQVSADLAAITPMDRVWVGRPVTESKDARDHCPAINTWWYGYHSEIYKTSSTPEAVAPNYTERYLIGLLRWAQAYLGADANQTYVTGGSMGGSGTVAMALHFPHVFAAACAYVPVYSCTRPGKGSARRLECMVGSLKDRKVVTSDGVPLLDYMNGAASMTKAGGDVPPIFSCNGRRDGSIPWENNPPFYRAANDARQAFAVFWNNGTHGMSREAPKDVKAWGTRMYAYRLDQSYLVFTNCSDNRNYGNGDPKDGDLVGWINRGLAWKDMVDTADTYEITVTADYPGIAYPITVDVTPRRVQRFRVTQGQRLNVRIGDAAPCEITVDAQGLFTAPKVVIRSAAGARISVRKTEGALPKN